MQASHFGQNLNAGARGAAESFNHFVEGPDDLRATAVQRQHEPERKDFWDDFSSLAASQDNRRSTPSGAIGTAAMKNSGGGVGATASSTTAAQRKDDSGGWDDNW